MAVARTCYSRPRHGKREIPRRSRACQLRDLPPGEGRALLRNARVDMGMSFRAIFSSLGRGMHWHPVLGPYFRAQRFRLPAVALLSLGATALEGGGIGLFVPLITAGQTVDQAALPRLLRAGALRWLGEGEMASWHVVAVLLLLLVVARAALQVLIERAVTVVHSQVAHDVRSRLVEVMLGQSYTFFLQHPASRLIALTQTESWRIADVVLQTFRLLSALCSCLVFGILLAYCGGALVAWVVVGAVLLRALQHRLERRIVRRSIALSAQSHRVLSRASTIVRAPRTWRLFGQEASELASFSRESARLRDVQCTLQFARAWAMPLQEVGGALLFIVVAFIATTGGVSAAVLVTFLALLYRLQPQLRAVQLGFSTLASLRGSVDEVAWLLSQPTEKYAHGGGRSWAFQADDAPIQVTFDTVCYRYPGAEDAAAALSGVSFTLPAGEKVALLGGSGAGKSTVVQLLTGLLEPDSGQVRIGGLPLREVSHTEWRHHLAVAGQDVELVEGTIAYNIAYGVLNATQGAIEEAARAADAHAFITAFPQGYATQVGVEGKALSVGQRQRIALARALLRQPRLLILDEATGAVDGPSEAAITAVLRRLPITTLVISHRRSTIAHCTWAVVLAEGKVVEMGPLRSTRYYRAMGAE